MDHTDPLEKVGRYHVSDMFEHHERVPGADVHPVNQKKKRGRPKLTTTRTTSEDRSRSPEGECVAEVEVSSATGDRGEGKRVIHRPRRYLDSGDDE